MTDADWSWAVAALVLMVLVGAAIRVVDWWRGGPLTQERLGQQPRHMPPDDQ